MILPSSRVATGLSGPAQLRDNDLLVPKRIDEPLALRLVEGDADHCLTEGGGDLAVFVGRSDSYCEGRLPLAGRYERDGDLLRFRPTFGFAAGQAYTVRTRRTGEPHRLTEFNIPSGTAAAGALVTEVFPSGRVLPENTLRFYVHFSVPMAPHLASDLVKLRDAFGVADDAAFMKFKQELWNENRTRLTVLMDPGRIKRSVQTKLDRGPALLEGNRYALTVNEGWPSADGSSVLPSYSKKFSVTAALRERPDIGLWNWRSPRSGTCEALKITFDRPFDRHLLSEALHIVSNDGRTIEGTAHVGDDESSWSFIPNEAWAAGGLRVTVNGSLEDVAGNNFRELLDRDVNDASVRHALTATVRIHSEPVASTLLRSAGLAGAPQAGSQ